MNNTQIKTFIKQFCNLQVKISSSEQQYFLLFNKYYKIDKDQVGRYISYMHYLIKHIFYVNFIFKMIKDTNKVSLPVGVQNVIKLHDFSKFNKLQFIAYANAFYQKDGSNKEKEKYVQFQYAWNDHQKRNKHHWQYWYLIQDQGNYKTLEIPTKYVIQMICDWASVGLVLTSGIQINNWYNKNKQNIIVNEKTRKQIQLLLQIFDLQTNEKIKQQIGYIAMVDICHYFIK